MKSKSEVVQRKKYPSGFVICYQRPGFVFVFSEKGLSFLYLVSLSSVIEQLATFLNLNFCSLRLQKPYFQETDLCRGQFVVQTVL